MIVAERLSGIPHMRRLIPGDAFRWTSHVKDELTMLCMVISSRLIEGKGNLEEEVLYVTGRELERQVTVAIVPYRIANVIVDG